MTDDQTANDECGICLETMTAAVTLPCNHKFCASCLDGWKSKFGAPIAYRKKERGKSCPLCRKKIPPSKDLVIQLEYHRKVKRRCEAEGDTTSETYMNQVSFIKRLEAEIGDYEGKGLDYDACIIELPEYIVEAVKNNNIKKVIKWLGSPVDKKRLSARYPDYLNSTLVNLAVFSANSDLLSILLQYGADVNALDAKGSNPLVIIASSTDYIDQAKTLLEWGVEISLSRSV